MPLSFPSGDDHPKPARSGGESSETRALHERLIEVGDQILGILESHRQANQSSGDASPRAFILAEAVMRQVA